MNRTVLCLFAIAILPSIIGACSSESVIYEPEGRDPDFEQEILDRLKAYNQEAVFLFSEATAASDEGRAEEAMDGFEQVLELVPDFPDALRRLSYVQGYLGDGIASLETANRAMEIDPSPYNEFAVARAHIILGSPRDAVLAFEHAHSALEELPEHEGGLIIMIHASLMSNHLDVAEQASENLLRIYPLNPLGHYFAGAIAAENGRWIKAEQEFRKSKRLGLPADLVDEVLNESGIHRMANIFRGIRFVAIVLISWVVALVLLYLVGSLLSSLTLRSIARGDSDTAVTIARGEQITRMLYRVVIGIASVYFYISIPILICIVIAAAGGVFLLFLQAGVFPIQISIIIVIGTIITLFALIRSLFAKYRGEAPGTQITHEDAPLLWETLYKVGQKLEAKPIETVFVNPLASIGVMERGSLRKRMMGHGERVLILGLGSLHGMTIGQFSAILAHEYGHFTHRDTAGGDLAKRVDYSIHNLVVNLARSGYAHWYNPAWLFVRGYYRVYTRITLGASRLQEILADRYAAFAYGKEDLMNGIRQVIRQQLFFLRQLDLEINSALEEGRGLNNIYRLPDFEEDIEIDELNEAYETLLNRPTSPYDSHPAPIDRFRMIEQLEGIARTQKDPSPAWSLIEDIENLQLMMTRLIQRQIPQLQPQPDELTE